MIYYNGKWRIPYKCHKDGLALTNMQADLIYENRNFSMTYHDAVEKNVRKNKSSSIFSSYAVSFSTDYENGESNVGQIKRKKITGSNEYDYELTGDVSSYLHVPRLDPQYSYLSHFQIVPNTWKGPCYEQKSKINVYDDIRSNAIKFDHMSFKALDDCPINYYAYTAFKVDCNKAASLGSSFKVYVSGEIGMRFTNGADIKHIFIPIWTSSTNPKDLNPPYNVSIDYANCLVTSDEITFGGSVITEDKNDLDSLIDMNKTLSYTSTATTILLNRFCAAHITLPTAGIDCKSSYYIMVGFPGITMPGYKNKDDDTEAGSNWTGALGIQTSKLNIDFVRG